MIEITIKIDSVDIPNLNIPRDVWKTLTSNGHINTGNAEAVDREVQNRLREQRSDKTSCGRSLAEQILTVLKNSDRPLSTREIKNEIKEQYSFKYIKSTVYELKKVGILSRKYNYQRRRLVYYINENVSERNKLQQVNVPAWNVSSKKANICVLKTLISSEKPMTGYDIIQASDFDYAYTYVQVILRNLRREGLVDCVIQGNRYLYTPTKKALSYVKEK